MKKTLKAKLIEEGIRLAWSSLESHLPFTYENKLPKRESKKFHIKCVKEYVRLMEILHQLY